MWTKIDKAWVSALVSFLCLTAYQFFGFEVRPDVQLIITNALISLIPGFFTWLVPNKPE